MLSLLWYEGLRFNSQEHNPCMRLLHHWRYKRTLYLC
uniref:Uncharacterized protein n=1 Tax=Rhizophora mucronata TaxID=61149 RepID=A0A2P2J582_RHIMU